MEGNRIAALVYVIIYSFFVFPSVGLFLYRFCVKPYWKQTGADAKATACARRVLLACCLCYICAAVMVFVGLCMFIAFGFEEPTPTMYTVFSLFYALALFLMLYVWIQRIKSTFTGSAYEYSPRFLLITKWTYWAVIVFALIVLVLFTTNDGNEEGESTMTVIISIMAAIFVLTFFSFICVILYTFISRLNRLRKIAEERLSKISDVGDYDFDGLMVIQKLVKLQLKLTISSFTAIVSTVVCIVMVIEFDQELQFMIYGVDTVLGFVCMYCTIKANNEFYEKICKLCIYTCDCCFNTSEIDRQTNHHIAIHSRSMNTGTAINYGGSNGSSGDGHGQPSAITMTSDQENTRDLQTITAADQATPRPSGHKVDESMPMDSVTMQNEKSEITVTNENSQM